MDEIPNIRLVCIKPCKEWDKLPTSTGAGFCPSTGFTTPKDHGTLKGLAILRTLTPRHTGSFTLPIRGSKIRRERNFQLENKKQSFKVTCHDFFLLIHAKFQMQHGWSYARFIFASLLSFLFVWLVGLLSLLSSEHWTIRITSPSYHDFMNFMAHNRISG